MSSVEELDAGNARIALGFLMDARSHHLLTGEHVHTLQAFITAAERQTAELAAARERMARMEQGLREAIIPQCELGMRRERERGQEAHRDSHMGFRTIIQLANALLVEVDK